MALPRSWVKAIFAEMSLVYGNSFLRRWDDIELEAVLDHWAEHLAGFHPYPEMLKYALANLPSSKPPTVLEFRDIARKMPPPIAPRLEAPKVNKEYSQQMMKLALSKIKRISSEP